MINDYPFITEEAEYKRIVQDAQRIRASKRHQQSLMMLQALARQI